MKAGSEGPAEGRGLPSWVARFSVRQPVLVNLLAIAIVILGGFVLTGMTREAFPNVPVGAAQIITVFPGASPEEIEQLITTPIEDELRDVEGIELIQSSSLEGMSRIWVEFEPEITDAARKTLEITNVVNRVTTLPEGADSPIVQEATINTPLGAVAVTGEAPEAVLREVARDLEERIEDIDGVARAAVTGLRDREIQVEVDPDRLAAYGLPLTAIAQAVRARAANVPAGEIEAAGRSQIVRGIAQATRASELREVVIRPDRGGGSVRVEDVAEVSEGFARARTLSRVNGEPAITFMVLKENGADALTISARLREVLEEARRDLPPGVSIQSFGDTAHYVEANLENLYSNAAMGLLLVLGILWFFVGFRNATMAALGIPVAIAGGVLVMHLLGITINLLSLLALILSLGVIVDDAIIIIENVYRHMEEGVPRMRAAVIGTAEVFWPVVASTATTCAAFLPLLLMTGVLGKFFAIIPKVIVAALVASLIEAFIVLPSHLADFGAVARKKEGPDKSWAARVGERVDAVFHALLVRALRLRWLVVFGAFFVCGGMIAAAVTLKEVVLFGDNDVEAFNVFVTMPTDTAAEETDRVLREVEGRILALEEPNIEAVSTMRGMTRRNHVESFGDHLGMVTVYMVPQARRTGPLAGTAAMARTEGLFADVVGPASLEVVKTEDGPPVGAPVAIRVVGDDFDDLAEMSERVQAELARVPGARDIGDDHELGKREVQVRIDEERAALYGLSTGQIMGWLATAFDAAPVATTRDGDEEIDIRVRLREEVRNDAARIGDLRLLTPEGADVALREVAEIEEGRGLAAIRHRDGARTITVTAQLEEGRTSAEVNRALAARIAPLAAQHPEVRFVLGGEFEKTNESLRSLFLAFIVAALLIYTILASQFRSFVQPMVVMTAIPLSLIGVTLGFFVSGEPIGMIGLIGTVGLAGIVVNDSLVLVSFINTRREEGAELDEAIVSAARLRLRPIFLTSVTTIAGLAPLAFGVGGRSPLLTPMATAIAWGLTFSTVLILVVIPCLYRISDGFSSGFRRIFAPLIHLATDPGVAQEGSPEGAEEGDEPAPAE